MIGVPAAARERNRIGESNASNPSVFIEVVGSGDRPYPCALLGIADGEAHIRSEEWIEPYSQLVLTFDNLAIPGSVLYSTRRGAGYRTAVKLGSELEQDRKEPRFPIDREGRITIMNEAGTVRSECRLTDIARSGLGLVAAQEADKGCMVYVVGDFGLVVGQVRHSLRNEDGRFRIGVETTGVFAGVELSRRSLSVLQRIRRRLAEAALGRKLPN